MRRWSVSAIIMLAVISVGLIPAYSSVRDTSMDDAEELKAVEITEYEGENLSSLMI